MAIQINSKGEVVGGTYASPTEILALLAAAVFGPADENGIVTIPEPHDAGTGIGLD